MLWSEFMVICFWVLLIPLLICSGILVFLIHRRTCTFRFWNAIALFALHLLINYALTMGCFYCSGLILTLFPLFEENGWVTLAISFVMSECVTIPVFYHTYRWIEKRKQKVNGKPDSDN